MTIRIISRPFHAVLDYLSGGAMLVSPWLFDFAAVTAARNIMVSLGIIVIGMSLLTNYEGGVFKKIAMTTHLWSDLFMGLFLALSPWLLHFNEETYIPHVAFGAFSVAASLLTVNSSQVKAHNPVDYISD